ncbi:MAG: hypothetical protein BGO68_00425 [Candidatus Amoebophilus sp. 36-38]|nr:MAG: hypothetical protein BGO68_00425 [Candidatus Amoebophilus sp. 36-38]
MKRKSTPAKRLAGHISIIGMILVLVISLLLENCLETCKSGIPGPKPLKDAEAKSALQLPSKTREDSEDTYSSRDYEFSMLPDSKDSVAKMQEKQVQEQLVPSSQKPIHSDRTLPSGLSTPIVESSVSNEQTAVNPSADNQRYIQTERSLAQSKALQLAEQRAQTQRETKESGISVESSIEKNKVSKTNEQVGEKESMPKEEFLQEKERKLLDRVFRTRENYLVKFYKEGTVWKANVVEGADDRKNRKEFDLPAYLGEDEDLERLLNARLLQQIETDDPIQQFQTNLIQVVLPSKEQSGYVYVGGMAGGSSSKKRVAQQLQQVGSEKEGKMEKEKKKKSKTDKNKEKASKPKATPSQIGKKKKQKSLSGGGLTKRKRIEEGKQVDKGEKKKEKTREKAKKSEKEEKKDYKNDSSGGSINTTRGTKRKRKTIPTSSDEGSEKQEKESQSSKQKDKKGDEKDEEDSDYILGKAAGEKLGISSVALTRAESGKLEVITDSLQKERLKKEQEERLKNEQEERRKILKEYKNQSKLLTLKRKAEANDKKEEEKEEVIEAQYIYAQYLLAKIEVILEQKLEKIIEGTSKQGLDNDFLEDLKSEKNLIKQSSEEAKGLLEEAIGWYLKAAFGGYEQAQVILRNLRDRGLYSNQDQGAMKWYKSAINKAAKLDRKPTFGFGKFVDRADRNSKKYQEKYQKKVGNTIPATSNETKVELKDKDKKKSKNNKKTRTRRPPMRISDLIVMELNDKVPAHIEWGGDYSEPEEANAGDIFGPLFRLPDTKDYEDIIMAIDPSGGGGDETAYCIAKRSGDYYFIIAVGGFAGLYDKTLTTNDTRGNSNEVLEKLVSIAGRNKINVLVFENNNDKSFGKPLKRELRQQGKLGLKIISQLQSKNKEKRIIDTLQPLLSEHRLIISREALKEDFNPELIKDLNFKFFYQLMAVVEDNVSAKKYLDGGKPGHDDRVDAAADAIRYLKERKERLDEARKALKELKKSIQTDEVNKREAYKIGDWFKNGKGIPIDYEKAAKWYAIAAEAGSLEAKYNLAWMYQKSFIRKEEDGLKVAIGLYQEAAKEDYPGALYELGKLHQKGEGVEKNEKVAVQYFEKAAKLGNAGAQFEMGRIRENEGKDEEARLLYQEAASQNCPDAFFTLGRIYQNEFLKKHEEKEKEKEKGKSENVPQNRETQDELQIINYFMKAARLGHVEAAREIGQIYKDDLFKIQKNFAKAMKWYGKAARQGDVIAQYNLGKIYENGWGINTPNVDKAFELYQVAAEQGYTEAQFEVGKMYENGIGTEVDYDEARRWYREASQKGHAEASFKMGEMYRKGQGAPKNEKEAVGFYKKAAEQGYELANNKLGWMYQYGVGVEQNEKQALEYYAQGAGI